MFRLYLNMLRKVTCLIYRNMHWEVFLLYWNICLEVMFQLLGHAFGAISVRSEQAFGGNVSILSDRA